MSIKFTSGFTVIELTVAVAITSLIMAMVLFNYAGFNDTLALSGAAQEVAIGIREAQTYGLFVRETAVGAASFSSGYGIYFNPTDNTTNKDYYTFIDTNADKKYTPGSGCGSGSTECIRKNTLRNGVVISSIDTTDGCSGINSARTLHITFLRPNPDARINFVNNGGNIVCNSELDGKIVLTSVQGKTLTITVENTGQVSIQ